MLPAPPASWVGKDPSLRLGAQPKCPSNHVWEPGRLDQASREHRRQQNPAVDLGRRPCRLDPEPGPPPTKESPQPTKRRLPQRKDFAFEEPSLVSISKPVKQIFR